MCPFCPSLYYNSLTCYIVTLISLHLLCKLIIRNETNESHLVGARFEPARLHDFIEFLYYTHNVI
jgi:hypothetical protein